jgi:hypothetical protein
VLELYRVLYVPAAGWSVVWMSGLWMPGWFGVVILISELREGCWCSAFSCTWSVFSGHGAGVGCSWHALLIELSVSDAATSFNRADLGYHFVCTSTLHVCFMPTACPIGGLHARAFDFECLLKLGVAIRVERFRSGQGDTNTV